MKKIVVLTGAGISAESGVSTFRDAGGLWENHDVMEVASIEGWEKNRKLVLDFYNHRRRQLKEVQPNEGHKALVDLEEKYNTIIVTQNVDNLHEKAGSTTVMHLHGELLKVRSTGNPDLVYHWDEDLNIGDNCEEGYQLRPHIVWFGEIVPLLHNAASLVYQADILIIVGTSMQVYPVAGLVGYYTNSRPIYYIDPKPHINYELGFSKNLKLIEEPASIGVRKVVDILLVKE